MCNAPGTPREGARAHQTRQGVEPRLFRQTLKFKEILTLVSLNKGTAAMSVSPTNPTGIEPILMQTFSFVLVETHAHWSRVWKQSLREPKRRLKRSLQRTPQTSWQAQLHVETYHAIRTFHHRIITQSNCDSVHKAQTHISSLEATHFSLKVQMKKTKCNIDYFLISFYTCIFLFYVLISIV